MKHTQMFSDGSFLHVFYALFILPFLLLAFIFLSSNKFWSNFMILFIFLI